MAKYNKRLPLFIIYCFIACFTMNNVYSNEADIIETNTSIAAKDSDISENKDELAEEHARFQHLKIIFGASMYFMLILLVFVFFSRQRLKLANKKLEQKQKKLEDSFQRLKEQEEEIRNSHAIVTQKREQLELALRSTRSITWEYNILTEEFSVDSQGLAMLGYSDISNFTSPKQLMDLIHPTDRDLFLVAFAQYLQGDSDRFMVEQRLMMKDGAARWFLSRGEMVNDKHEEKPTRMVGLMWDITDRKNWEKTVTSGHEQLQVAKEELRIAHLELKSAFDDLKINQEKVEFALKSARVGSWEYDVKRNLIKVDEFGKKYLPFEVEKNSFPLEKVGQVIPSIYYRELVVAMELHKKKIDSSITVEFPIKNDNNASKWIRIKGSILKWDKNGDPELLVGTLHDVNDGRRMILFLQEQKLMNEAILKNIPGQVVYYDRSLKILWANEAFHAGLKEEHSNLIDIHEGNENKSDLPAIEAMKKNKKVTRTLKNKANNRIYSLVAIPVVKTDGKVEGCVMSLQDVLI